MYAVRLLRILTESIPPVIDCWKRKDGKIAIVTIFIPMPANPALVIHVLSGDVDRASA